MKILEKLEKESSTIGLVILTFLLISIQIIFFIPNLIQPIVFEENNAKIFLPTTPILIIIYFILPIIYCTIISILFKPKRILSPIYVQIGTIAFLLFLIIFKVTISTNIQYPENLLSILISTIFLNMFFAVYIGFFQLLVIKWVVGLNFDSVDQKTYKIEGVSLDKLIEFLEKKFFNIWSFNKNKKDKIYIFTRKDNRRKTSIIISIGSQDDDKNKLIFA